MLIKILIGIGVLVVVFLVVVAMRPSDFRVTRSASIAAPAGVVFPHVNDLHKWEAWSPWAKLDPSAKTSYAGPAAGNGAMFHWAGSNKVGEGSMTIVESRPNELVRLKLDFIKPFTASNTADFTFKEERGQTIVTWSMYGKSNFMSKAIGLFMDCDKMVGCQFEKGLADMKTIVESRAANVSTQPQS